MDFKCSLCNEELTFNVSEEISQAIKSFLNTNAHLLDNLSNVRKVVRLHKLMVLLQKTRDILQEKGFEAPSNAIIKKFLQAAVHEEKCSQCKNPDATEFHPIVVSDFKAFYYFNTLYSKWSFISRLMEWTSVAWWLITRPTIKELGCGFKSRR